MKITGIKRWFIVVLCALMAGIMVYVPFLRYSYYDQMCILFTQYKAVVPADSVNRFIGDFGMAFGIVSMLGYPLGGIFADRFQEKWLLIAGGVLMGVCSFWFGLVPGKIEIIIIHLLYGVGTSFMIWSAYLKLTRKILVFLMIALGIASLMFANQGDQALVWLILNKMPSFCGIILAESVLAACMSCADTHLNCAAANIVADIMDPESKLDSAISIRYAKWATLAAGIVAILSGMFGSFIYALGTYGYTVCGGVLIPAFVVGLICRDRKSESFRSKMSIMAAKAGMGAGVVTAILFELIPSWKAVFGGGVLPAIVVTMAGMLIINLFCHDQTWKAEK